MAVINANINLDINKVIDDIKNGLKVVANKVHSYIIEIKDRRIVNNALKALNRLLAHETSGTDVLSNLLDFGIPANLMRNIKINDSQKELVCIGNLVCNNALMTAGKELSKTLCNLEVASINLLTGIYDCNFSKFDFVTVSYTHQHEKDSTDIFSIENAYNKVNKPEWAEGRLPWFKYVSETVDVDELSKMYSDISQAEVISDLKEWKKENAVLELICILFDDNLSIMLIAKTHNSIIRTFWDIKTLDSVYINDIIVSGIFDKDSITMLDIFTCKYIKNVSPFLIFNIKKELYLRARSVRNTVENETADVIKFERYRIASLMSWINKATEDDTELSVTPNELSICTGMDTAQQQMVVDKLRYKGTYEINHNVLMDATITDVLLSKAIMYDATQVARNIKQIMAQLVEKERKTSKLPKALAATEDNKLSLSSLKLRLLAGTSHVNLSMQSSVSKRRILYVNDSDSFVFFRPYSGGFLAILTDVLGGISDVVRDQIFQCNFSNFIHKQVCLCAISGLLNNVEQHKRIAELLKKNQMNILKLDKLLTHDISATIKDKNKISVSEIVSEVNKYGISTEEKSGVIREVLCNLIKRGYRKDNYAKGYECYYNVIAELTRPRRNSDATLIFDTPVPMAGTLVYQDSGAHFLVSLGLKKKVILRESDNKIAKVPADGIYCVYYSQTVPEGLYDVRILHTDPNDIADCEVMIEHGEAHYGNGEIPPDKLGWIEMGLELHYRVR